MREHLCVLVVAGARAGARMCVARGHVPVCACACVHTRVITPVRACDGAHVRVCMYVR